jgi:outer membrane protein TolC
VGGKKFYTLKKELQGLEVLRNQYRKIEQEIKFETTKAFYEVLFVQEKLKNINKLLENLKKENLILEKKHKAKVITDIEYLEAKNIYNDILLQQKTFVNELNVAVLNLKSVCNVGFDTEINLLDESVSEVGDDLNFDIEQYKDIALKKRPEIRALKGVLLQTKYADRVAKADGWPAFSVDSTVGKSGEAFVRDELVLATEWTVFANLQWMFWGSSIGMKYGEKQTEPSEILDTSIRTRAKDSIIQLNILDKLDYYYNKQERKVSYKQAIKDLEDTKKKTCIEVEKSYGTFQVTKEMIKFSKSKVELMEKQNKIVEKKNFLDEASLKDVIQIKFKLVEEKNKLLEAVTRHNIAFAELKLYSGIDVYPLRRDKSSGRENKKDKK